MTNAVPFPGGAKGSSLQTIWMSPAASAYMLRFRYLPLAIPGPTSLLLQPI